MANTVMGVGGGGAGGDTFADGDSVMRRAGTLSDLNMLLLNVCETHLPAHPGGTWSSSTHSLRHGLPSFT